MLTAKNLEIVCLSLGPIFVLMGIALVVTRSMYARMHITRREMTVIALGAFDVILAGWVSLKTF